MTLLPRLLSLALAAGLVLGAVATAQDTKKADKKADAKKAMDKKKADKKKAAEKDDEKSATTGMTFEVATQADGKYRWKLVNQDGVSLAMTTRAYKTKKECLDAIEALKAFAAKGQVKEVEKKDEK